MTTHLDDKSTRGATMKPGIILCIGTKEQRARICRWLTANGANPNRIPESARIIVTGNRIIVQETIRDQQRKGGKRARVHYGEDWARLVTRPRSYRIRYDLKDIR